MSLQWLSAKVVRKTIWAPGLFTLTLEVPGVEKFEPGQFLQLGFETPDKHLHRPYSVASPHSSKLEFFIVMVPDGQLTPRLWDLKVGDRVDVSTKAVGSFTLSHCPDADHLWLVATGTGIAPYIAMLRDGSLWSRYKRVILVHGVRHTTDLAYQVELENCAVERGDQFKYVAVVSRSLSSDVAEAVLTGRITTVFQDGQLENAAGIPIAPDRSALMLCGNPAMLDEMEAMLVERDLSKHKTKTPGHFVIERYW